MAWAKGDLITASKLNSENKDVQTGYANVALNNSGIRSIVKYIHKPASSSTRVARFYCQSNDGWFNTGSEHEISVIPLTSNQGHSFSDSNLPNPVKKSGVATCFYHYQPNGHHTVRKDITGASIPRSGWYQFVITQNNRIGGENMEIWTYTYPMSAVSGHQIVAYGSNGNRIYNKELSAENLNGRYITTI